MSCLVALMLLFQLAVPGREWSADEYLERVRSAREEASAAARNPSGHSEAVRALEALRDVTVRVPDGEALEVRNHWVDDAVRELREDRTGEAAGRTLARLRAIEKEIEGLQGRKSPLVSAELAAGEEFGESAAKPGIEDVDLGIKNRLRSFAEWLRETLQTDNRPRRRTSISVPRAVAWIVAVGLVCLLVFLVIRHIMRGRAFDRPELMGGPRVRSLLEDALRRTPEQWKELASQYFAKGDFTQALRALYLGLLVVLHRRRLISYETSRTNWEYVWELGTAKPEHEPFAELTRAFDYKWYGRESCTSEDYLALESRADQIIAAPAQVNEQR